MPSDARSRMHTAFVLPADAPQPPAPPALLPWRWQYVDPAGRAMKGRVAYTPLAGHPVPVVAELDEHGVVQLDLPPGDYESYAQLRTVDGERVVRTGRFTLNGAQSD